MKKLIFTILAFGLLTNISHADTTQSNKVNDIINRSNTNNSISLIKITFKGFNNGYIKEAIEENKTKIAAYKELQNIYKYNPELNEELTKLIELYEEDTQYKIMVYNKDVQQLAKVVPIMVSGNLKSIMINTHIENINNIIKEL